MTDQLPVFALGDRVRTTIDVNSLWLTSPDFPAGSLGLIQRLHSDGSFGVLLDDDPTRTLANFEADEIEAAGAGPVTAQRPDPVDVLAQIAQRWVDAQPDPATAVQRARREFDLNFGLLGGFHTKRDRFEAAVRADARQQALTEAAELIRAQHSAVYEDAGQSVASGLLHAADLLDAARTPTS